MRSGGREREAHPVRIGQDAALGGALARDRGAVVGRGDQALRVGRRRRLQALDLRGAGRRRRARALEARRELVGARLELGAAVARRAKLGRQARHAQRVEHQAGRVLVILALSGLELCRDLLAAGSAPLAMNCAGDGEEERERGGPHGDVGVRLRVRGGPNVALEADPGGGTGERRGQEERGARAQGVEERSCRELEEGRGVDRTRRIRIRLALSFCAFFVFAGEGERRERVEHVWSEVGLTAVCEIGHGKAAVSSPKWPQESRHSR